MRRWYDSRAVVFSQGAFVFASVFLALLFLKHDFIVNEIFIEDDLELYYRANYEALTNPLPGRPVGSFVYWMTATVLPNISYQMIFYLLSLSTTALMTFLLFYRVFSQTWILIIGILFAFTSHAVTSAVNFTSANHGVLGLMFASVGLLLSYHGIVTDRTYWKRIIVTISSCVFLVLAAFSSPYFYMIFLGALPLFFSGGGGRFWRRREMYVAATLVLLPSVTLFLYLIIGKNFYHYDRLIGWSDYSFMHFLERMLDYIKTVGSPWVEYAPDPLILCLAAGAGAGISWLTLKMNMRPRGKLEFGPDEKNGRVAGFLVLFLGSILTLSSILPATMSFQPRHIYPTTILGILAAFSAADLLLVRWGSWFANNKWAIVLFSALLLGYNFSVTNSYQHRHYGELIAYQPVLKEFIRKEKDNWSRGAQIIIVSDIPSKFTYGLNMWSTGFLRILTGDETLFGLIGSEKETRWHQDPFVDSYRHRHSQYWKIIQVNGKPKNIRLRMFGIVQKAPTYAYRFDPAHGVERRIHWILVHGSESYSLYAVTDSGLLLRRTGGVNDSIADLARLGLDRDDVLVWGRLLD